MQQPPRPDSYLDNLPKENRDNLTEIPSTLRAYLASAIRDFKENFPENLLSSATIKVKDKIFRKRISIEGELEHSVSFENCYFLSEVSIRDLKTSGKLSFKQCCFDKGVHIDESTTIEKDFELIDVKLKGKLYVKGGTFDICNWNFIDNSTVTVAGGDYKELNIGHWSGGSVLRDLTIDLNHRLKGHIRITGTRSQIEKLIIFKSASEVSISLEDISVGVLSVHGFRNDKNFRISNLKPMEGFPAPEVSIMESYLGKAEFYNIDFRDFDVLNIRNSHLLDSSFVNVRWKYPITSFKGSGVALSDDEILLPGKIKKLEGRDFFSSESISDDPSVIRYYQMSRETYRQLKHVYGKQGDTIYEKQFLSREMMAFNRTINYRSTFFTKAIIEFSYLFSNFGASLLRPLAALITGHFILMFLLIFFGGIDGLNISFCNPTFEGFEYGFEKFFFYINPLRKIDSDFKGYFIIFDLGMRIWSSFMIYNIIRATRRFIG